MGVSGQPRLLLGQQAILEEVCHDDPSRADGCHTKLLMKDP